MQTLTGVLFHVQSRDADAFRASISRGNVDPSVLREWLVVLRNLVALGQVGIEIVFAGKNRALIHCAMQGQRRQGREFDGFCIQHRQSPREPQAYRADVRVGRGAKPIGATAKCFGRGEKLHVNFEADHRLVLSKNFRRRSKHDYLQF